jgi:hypothetical protein
MKKLFVLFALAQLSLCLRAQEMEVAQLPIPSSLSLPGANAAPSSQSDQLFSDATEKMFSGQNEQAFALFTKAASTYKSEKRFHEWSGCFAGIAIVLASEGHYRKFLRISKRALRVHNKFNALDLEAEETLRSNVGMGYHLVGNVKKANKYWPVAFVSKS